MRSHTSTTGRFWGEFDVCNAGNLLKPMLGRGELRCIGATTLDEYRQHIEKDPALERRFQQVLVEQPSVPQTVSILRGLRERYELHHGVRISDSALVEAANLSHRCAPNEPSRTFQNLPCSGGSYPYGVGSRVCPKTLLESTTLLGSTLKSL